MRSMEPPGAIIDRPSTTAGVQGWMCNPTDARHTLRLRLRGGPRWSRAGPVKKSRSHLTALVPRAHTSGQAGRSSAAPMNHWTRRCSWLSPDPASGPPRLVYEGRRTGAVRGRDTSPCPAASGHRLGPPELRHPDFDMTLAAPLTFAAICLWAFRGDVHLRGRSQHVRYYAIATYFTLSVPIHVSTYFTRSTE